MSRRSHNSVSLFPFLAVLVCAMGALIFLLLVTTRRIRSEAIARATNDVSQVATPVEIDAWPRDDSDVQSALTSRLLIETDTPESGAADLETRDDTFTSPERKVQNVRQPFPVIADPPAVDHDAELRRQIDRLLTSRESLYREREQYRSKQQRLAAETNRIRTALAKSESQLKTLRTAELQSRETETTLQNHQRELNHSLAARTGDLQSAQAAVASAASRFAFLPFDGTTGTVRRPILIECTATGFRFLPENVDVREEHLMGFSPEYNPLLAGASALCDYWAEQAPPDGSEPARPCVLVLVRPTGSLAFYAAKKLLSELNEPFGYELIDESQAIALPEVDPNAEAACRRAVEAAIRERALFLRSFVQRNPTSNGRVIRLGPNGQVLIDEGGDPGDRWQMPPGTGQRPAVADGFSGGQGERGQGTPEYADGLRSAAAQPIVRPSSGAQSRTGYIGETTVNGAPGSAFPFPPAPTSGDTEIDTARIPLTNPLSSKPQSAAAQRSLPDGAPSGSPSPNVPGSASTGIASLRANEGNPGFDFSNFIELDAANSAPSQMPETSEDASAMAGTLPPLTTSQQNTARERSASDPLRQAMDGLKHGNNPSTAGGAFGASPETANLDFPLVPLTPLASSDGPTDRSTDGPNALNGPTVPRSDNIESPGKAQQTLDSTASIDSRPQPKSLENALSFSETLRQSHAQNADNRSARSTLTRNGKHVWGHSRLGASIGFEREMTVQIDGGRLTVGDRRVVVLHAGMRQDVLEARFIEALDQHAKTWGHPPRNFYWVPTLRFRVQPEGQLYYERLREALHELRISSTVKFETEAPSEPAGSGPLKKVSQTSLKLPSASSRFSRTPVSTPAARFGQRTLGASTAGASTAGGRP